MSLWKQQRESLAYQAWKSILIHKEYFEVSKKDIISLLGKWANNISRKYMEKMLLGMALKHKEIRGKQIKTTSYPFFARPIWFLIFISKSSDNYPNRGFWVLNNRDLLKMYVWFLSLWSGTSFRKIHLYPELTIFHLRLAKIWKSWQCCEWMYTNRSIDRLLVGVQIGITFVHGGQFWYYLLKLRMYMAFGQNLQSQVSWYEEYLCVD